MSTATMYRLTPRLPSGEGRTLELDERTMESHKRRGDVTGLLLRWSGGEKEAVDELAPLVYDELRKIARGHLRRERDGHSLESVDLANEAYLRLVDNRRVDWQSRAHFFAIASTMMRRILVDQARRRRAAKRGAGEAPVEFDESKHSPADDGVDLLALDEALTRLEAVDARQSRLVELRFFGGLTVGETAEVLGVSPQTVHRDWSFARAWLYRELSAD